MIAISRTVSIADNELEITAIRAQGAGGQHVNKTSSAIHLRFDIRASGLPEYYKQRLLTASHHLISDDGVIIIKAQEFRSQELNREAAIARLVAVIKNSPRSRKTSRNPSDACLEGAPLVLEGAKIFCKGASRQSSSSTGLTGRNSNFIRILW